jgi:dienelactone hydrolase
MPSRAWRVISVPLVVGAALLVAALGQAATDVANDRIHDDGFEPYAGSGPTQTCPYTPDENGFFTLTSSASSYAVRLPPSYDPLDPQPQRLLVALHGCSDTAMNFATWAAAPYALRPTQDYIAISVGGRDGQCWNATTDAPLVDAAIEHASSCFYVHQHKIVLAGYSSGGGLAYRMSMTNAYAYAGVLIENSSLRSVVGSTNVDAVLDAADWTIHVAHTARLGDQSYPIDGVVSDRDKMLAHGFPVQFREVAGQHGDTDGDWDGFLIPAMADWVSP